MDWMTCVDLSCSMLFEATADSEADSDINKNMDHALLGEDAGSSEDDAMSCSCDDSVLKEFDLSDANHEFDLVAEQEVSADDHNYNNCDAEDEEEDEEGTVNQLRNESHEAKDLKRAGAAAYRGVLIDQERQPKKRKVCADSVKEFMNERDNDRLFWETCLAS